MDLDTFNILCGLLMENDDPAEVEKLAPLVDWADTESVGHGYNGWQDCYLNT